MNQLSKQLRINNLIIGTTEDEDGNAIEHICKVVALDSVSVTEYAIWVESEDDSERYEDFYGIPLTEDWLRKLGFRKHMGGFAKNILFFEQFEDGYDLMNIDALDMNFKYVHQLQNLYHALTGEELTIKEPIKSK